MSLGLILLAAFIVLNGDMLHGQGSDYALFIDEKGNVGIGTNQPATKLAIEGAAKAKAFRCDGQMSDLSQVPQGNDIYTGMSAITDFRGPLSRIYQRRLFLNRRQITR